MLQYPLPAPFPVGQGFNENAQVYRAFGMDGHNGIDYLCGPGTLVRAMHSGIVRFAGDGALYPVAGSAAGLYVLIEDDSGKFCTGYAHLRGYYVEAGQHVEAGETIASSGATGAVTGAHLHVEYLPLPLDLTTGYFGRIDPQPFLDALATAEAQPTEDAPGPAEDTPAEDADHG